MTTPEHYTGRPGASGAASTENEVIANIQQYVDRYNLQNQRYDLTMIEGLELSRVAYEATDLPLGIIVLAFNYGRAKGYRAAKAEARP